MKIAVLADLHANLPALHAVAADLEAWSPDTVIVAGDLINRGPRSPECLAFVQARLAARPWHMLLGNHEEYVIRHADPDAPRSGPKFDIRQGSYFTYCQLDHDVAALETLPFSLSLAMPDGSTARFAHASMRGTRDGVYPRTPDQELRDQIGHPTPSLFCVGHTHLPVVRQLDRALVVNAGSAGMPFDGDTRASYAQLTWRDGQWSAAIIRLRYDLAQADRDYDQTGFVESGGPLARLMRIELNTGRSQLYQWAQRYESLVLSGVLTMEASVAEFLEE